MSESQYQLENWEMTETFLGEEKRVVLLPVCNRGEKGEYLILSAAFELV